MLIDLRDGIVHAAMNDEIEERILVAFVQHADALLKDLGRDRTAFWNSRLEVVDALLADASDKVQHRVEVMLAGARARFDQRYGQEPEELVQLVRRLEEEREPDLDVDDAGVALRIWCPVCEMPAPLHFAKVEMQARDEDGQPLEVPRVNLTVDGLDCRICGLRLRGRAEMDAAGVLKQMGIEDSQGSLSFIAERDESE
jgi:hypothetical protein